MSTAPAFDLALNDMLSVYKADLESKEQTNLMLVKAATKAASQKKDSVKVERIAPPASNGEATVIVASPKFKLDAKGFLLALKECGYRTDRNGLRYFSQDVLRDDQIKAIDAFIGYDNRKDFASQELAARSQAIREIRKAQGEDLTLGMDRAEKRRVNASLSGYVAGMPDHAAKDLANLEARERLAVQTLIEHERQSELAPTEQERAKAAAFAQLERERLIEIRRDMAVHGR